MLSAFYGDSDERFFLAQTTISGTTPIVGIPVPLKGYNILGAQFVTDGTVDGAWLIEVSNDYQPASPSNMTGYGQAGNAGHWTVIPNSEFSPTIAAVDHTVTTTQNQPVLATLPFRCVRFTFTPSAGAGTAQVIGCCKSE